MGWLHDLIWGPAPEFKPSETLPFLRWRDGRLVRPRIPPPVQYFLQGARLPWVNEHELDGRRPEDPPPTRRG